MKMIEYIENIDWEAFHFLRPQFLWLLAPVGLVFILGMIGNRKKAGWQKNIAPHLRKYVISKGSEKKARIIRFFTIVLLALAILGLAGPVWKKIKLPGKILETPVVILLDISQSMMATDISPNRLERAKFKISDFLDANAHARTALVGFAGTAHRIVPLTSDYSIIKSHIQGLKPNIMPIPGSNLEDALILTDSITSKTNAPGKVIIFTDDFHEKIFTLIQQFALKSNNTIDIIPMNTPGGANIPRPYPYGRYFFKEKNGKLVNSSLNTEIINRLSEIKNINISRLTLDKSDMELLAKQIGENLKFKEKDKEKEDEWKDEALYLAIPFTLLALLWFRKGWLIFSIIFTFSLSSCKNKNTSLKNLFYTKDYQAQQAYDKGEYAKAAELFTKPTRKGNSWFKAGKYEKAIAAYKQDSTANGSYNLGLAYYKTGRYTKASKAFEKALKLNPDLGDAKTNYEISKQIAEKNGDIFEAVEAEEHERAENIENKDEEDLGGGGQEATEEDMEKERKEETVATDKRKGKELEELPDDFKSENQKKPSNIVLEKVDDDPSLFLKRKFNYQIREGIVSEPSKEMDKW